LESSLPFFRPGAFSHGVVSRSIAAILLVEVVTLRAGGAFGQTTSNLEQNNDTQNAPATTQNAPATAQAKPKGGHLNTARPARRAAISRITMRFLARSAAAPSVPM
jgi:hypothetical protein